MVNENERDLSQDKNSHGSSLISSINSQNIIKNQKNRNSEIQQINRNPLRMRISDQSRSLNQRNLDNRHGDIPITSFQQASMFNNNVCNMVQNVKSIIGSSQKSENKSSNN